MNLPPICANPVSCIDNKCCRRHAFYLVKEEREIIKRYIDRKWKSQKLSNYRFEFPKKPNWCYDGHFCLNKNCIYDHILDINGRNIVYYNCKKDINDIPIPIPE